MSWFDYISGPVGAADTHLGYPRFTSMVSAYSAYLDDEVTMHPCRLMPPSASQCGVRMSVALHRCGIRIVDTGSFRAPHDVHARPSSRCEIGTVPHIIGAARVSRFLKAYWGSTLVYSWRRGGTLNARQWRDATILNKNGIIYFNHCFVRDDGKLGDHIDLWTGLAYWLQDKGESIGGDAPAGVGLFGTDSPRQTKGDLDYMIFFELPAEELNHLPSTAP